ncbi:UDP-2,3-diacylglucosamine diphosphatase LpxI [Roseovarius sp. SCSIO 43702]|uniref:LpxI family protein n=1 Tax=Roseovarius sp. SCSIO 43702 TaxID=2823043 RepID=UPI001C73D3FF|nr:UDP-2,3-diacylglucosamine diphosphatase LpxI [Roseovarius sp. SCSIO 43702]QYX58407.1 UDP-2,3-diacylglucosamine diphosphatase LpxI [Roseovarius sp. SCSIO 43702]
MAGRLAILACGGALPVRISDERPDALIYTLRGIPSAIPQGAEEHQLEKIGTLFGAMKDAGVTRLVFAGHLTRPAINPAECDAEMLRLAPRVMQALPRGDDALLREVIAIFEEQGFEVVGAHELLPDLAIEDGVAVGVPPDKQDEADMLRGFEVLRHLSPLDIGQGCVVAGGQCLGIETVQGTDAMLRFVAETPETLRRGRKGIYAKAAKLGQDLRVDMPAIGPETVAGVAEAGLAGIVVGAGSVMVLDREGTFDAVEKAGLFLLSRPF